MTRGASCTAWRAAATVAASFSRLGAVAVIVFKVDPFPHSPVSDHLAAINLSLLLAAFTPLSCASSLLPLQIRQAFPRFDIRRARAYLSLFIAQDAAMTGRIDFAQFKAFLTSIPTAGPGGVPGGASAIVKAISASARSRASSGPSPHSGSDAGSSSSSGTPASASSASASATFTGTPASAASAAGSGSGSGSGAVLPHLARESLLEGLFAYLDKRGYGTLAFRDVFVGVAVLRGLVSRAVVASLLARCPSAVCGVSQVPG